MSGSPTQAEVQAQWRAVINILEKTRNHADGTVAGAGGLFDTLVQALEGEYTPASLTQFVARYRADLSSLLDGQRALDAIQPCLFEYGKLISDGGFRDMRSLWRALYKWFVDNSLTVESRAITYDSSATAGAGNTGNGVMSRLTVDENNFTLEACTVETKRFRCVADQNTGADKWAEVFECIGAQQSQDALLLASFGSGTNSRVRIVSKHAGTGDGGSRLRNSSFDTFNSGSSPKFQGWTETAGSGQITQDTTNYYRGNPSSSTDGALKITGGSGTVTLTQTLSDMQIRELDPDKPYFLRLMVNKTIGTASGGNIVVSIGGVDITQSIAGLGSGWQEILLAVGSDCWPRNFNEDGFAIVIKWETSTSGYLLVDDVIFTEWDMIDGTYWCLRQNAASPAAWLVDDTLEFTDTGGAPATAKIQWWNWVAGLGYLPSTTGTPTFTEPV